MKTLGRLMIIMALALAGLVPGLAVSSLQAAATAAGFVAGIQGRAYIVRNKDSIMISGMDLLYQGDSVRLSKGSTARISVCGGKGYEIRGAAEFTMGRAGIRFRQGKATKTYAVDRKACSAALEVFGKNDRDIPEMVKGERKGTLMLRSRKKSERRGVYVVRGRKQVPVIDIYSGKLAPQKPQILWTPVEGRVSYRVALKSGEETLWNTTVTKSSCVYPDNAPPLAEGREYNVSIEAVAADGTVLASGSGVVSIYNNAELESLRQDESSIRAMMPENAPGRHILLGKLFEARGQFAEALASYEKALSLDSGNAGLKDRVVLLKKIME